MEYQVIIFAAFIFYVDIAHPFRAALLQCVIAVLSCFFQLFRGKTFCQFGITEFFLCIFLHICQRYIIDVALYVIPIIICKIKRTVFPHWLQKIYNLETFLRYSFYYLGKEANYNSDRISVYKVIKWV